MLRDADARGVPGREVAEAEAEPWAGRPAEGLSRARMCRSDTSGYRLTSSFGSRSHQCSAVMPFGEIVEHPAEKTKLPMSERLKVYLD